ncbi:lytic transglycosylase domain-containing protein [Streptomyces sp. NPDC004134]|uniref:lytic transglycosylase domain-containing protein n=1 Tax=Streptomyces sp. NPDC004134 TaxID=3364691 RepID=UPI0036A87168
MGRGATGEGQESRQQKTQTTLLLGGFVVGSLGCVGTALFIIVLLAAVLIVCAIGFLLWPLVMICQIFDVCGSDGENNDEIVRVVNGNGKDALYAPAVQDDLLEAVRKAGRECTEIGPVVIAAQIQQESGWNEDLVGPDGEKGISQLPPDKFDEFGEDEDDSGETSATDPEDSIVAQGKYLCSLAEEIAGLLKSGAVEGDPLDLTLAAYDVGLDVIKDAKGIPKGSPANGYVSAVRSAFPLYAGTVKPPDGEDYPSLEPRPTPS